MKIFLSVHPRRSAPGNETMEKRFVPRGGASRARFRGALSFLAMVVIMYHHWGGRGERVSFDGDGARGGARRMAVRDAALRRR